MQNFEFSIEIDIRKKLLVARVQTFSIEFQDI